jgi:hypothetical protein
MSGSHLTSYEAVGYTVSLTDDNNDTVTLVPELWTLPLVIHLVGGLFKKHSKFIVDYISDQLFLVVQLFYFTESRCCPR